MYLDCSKLIIEIERFSETLPVDFKDKVQFMLSEGVGNVYAFGFGGHGQLGLGNFKDSNVPQLVAAVEGKQITQVCCGGGHTVALTAKGELYLWGDGRNGLAQVFSQF